MVITARHLAKRAPSLKYSSRRLEQPVEPLGDLLAGRSGEVVRALVDLDAGDDALLREIVGNGVPSSVFWRIVSSNRITPERNCSMPGVVKSSPR